jgi:hypothetical protein
MLVERTIINLIYEIMENDNIFEINKKKANNTPLAKFLDSLEKASENSENLDSIERILNNISKNL